MKIKQRNFFQLIFIFISYFVLFAVILNCNICFLSCDIFYIFFIKVYLSLYESQEKYETLNDKQRALYSYFNKFTNISYPISYSLEFYENYTQMPTIYVITPTYRRATQLAELTRLKNTLWLTPKIHWIIIEDSNRKTDKIKRFLKESSIPSVHLNIETPDDLKIKPGDLPWSKPRGVFQRNLAIQWLRDNMNILGKGVVYFADDDNSYDIRIFEQVLLNFDYYTYI